MGRVSDSTRTSDFQCEIFRLTAMDQMTHGPTRGDLSIYSSFVGRKGSPCLSLRERREQLVCHAACFIT